MVKRVGKLREGYQVPPSRRVAKVGVPKPKAKKVNPGRGPRIGPGAISRPVIARPPGPRPGNPAYPVRSTLQKVPTGPSRRTPPGGPTPDVQAFNAIPGSRVSKRRIGVPKMGASRRA